MLWLRRDWTVNPSLRHDIRARSAFQREGMNKSNRIEIAGSIHFIPFYVRFYSGVHTFTVSSQETG